MTISALSPAEWVKTASLPSSSTSTLSSIGLSVAQHEQGSRYLEDVQDSVDDIYGGSVDATVKHSGLSLSYPSTGKSTGKNGVPEFEVVKVEDSNAEAGSGDSTGDGSYYHKDLFPLDQSDYIGTFLVVIGLMIAASGGIGGGGLLVPIFIIVYGFKPIHAVALSNFTILGSSIMNMLLNLSKRHPMVDRPLVDWDLIVVMEPLTMAGAIFGAYVGKLLPEVFLVISLVVLLGYTSKITLEKGLQLWRKETKEAADRRGSGVGAGGKSALVSAMEEKEQEDEQEETASLLGANGATEGDEEAGKGEAAAPVPACVSASASANIGEAAAPGGMHPTSTNGTTGEVELAHRRKPNGISEENSLGTDVHVSPLDQDAVELKELLERERHTPLVPVVWMNVMFIVVIILNMLKGGGGGRAFPSPIGVECGSWSYWGLTAAIFVFVIGVSLYMRHLLVEKWRLKRRLRYPYAAGDVEWNEYNTLLYPALCVFAGLCAGMFGIGGGIVKGPLMLQMEVHPLVASATVAVMIFFTSIAATSSYIAFGILIWDYGWFLFILGLGATLVGQYGVGWLVKKYNRVSLVSLSIGAVVSISTVLMAMQSIYSILISPTAAENEKTSTICGN